MADFEIKVTTVPQDQAISGESYYDVEIEERVVQIRKRWKPIYAYCPSCTKTTEYDKQWKEHRDKRMSVEDYHQEFRRIVCKESPSGWTNQCLNCGFHMNDVETQEVPVEEDRGEDSEIEWKNYGYLYEGSWWITLENLKEMLRQGYDSTIDLTFAFVIEGQTRLLPYDKIKSMVKAKEMEQRDGSVDMGIPVHLFRTL